VPASADRRAIRSKLLVVSALVAAAAARTVPPPPAPPTTTAAPTTTGPTTTTSSTSTTSSTTSTSTTTTTTVPTAFDFDGDGRTDQAWIDRATGTWYLGPLSDAHVLYQGLSTDLAVPADYDGDGPTDIVVVRDGIWLRADGTELADLPAPPGTMFNGRAAEPSPASHSSPTEPGPDPS
jgi:hypothetical protein